MIFRQLFDLASSTYTYLLGDEETGEALIVDPVVEQIDRDLGLVAELGLHLRYALDTHVHADHVSALGALRARAGCATVLCERAGVGCPDVLVKDGDRVRFGRRHLEVRETPGHTNGCVTYVTDDRRLAFTGDTLLVRGCGRTDFQGGDARALYRSVHARIFTLPDDTLVYPAHDYKGRTATSVAEEKRHNPRLGGGRTEDEFVAIMASLALAYPAKMDVALPANLHCGAPADAAPLPEPSWSPVEISSAGVPEVSVDWVAATPWAARLVDVREPDELAGPLGCIAGVASVPLAGVAAAAEAWDRAAPIVLICRSGGRSAKAALDLARLGFTKIASMRGGMMRWNEAKLPIAKEPA